MHAPVGLYRYRLGRRSVGEVLLWILYWHPHIRIAHRGRVTGRLHQTIVEVIRFDPRRNEWLVAAMFGPRSDWYRNLWQSPAVEVEVRGETFQPTQRMLPDDAAQRELDDYRRRNPIWSRIAGLLIGRPFTAASMPVVAFGDPRAGRPLPRPIRLMNAS